MKSAELEQGRESEGVHSPTMTIIPSADGYGRSAFPSIDEAFAALCRTTSAGSQLERGKGVSLEDAFSEDETALSLHVIDRKLIKFDSIIGGGQANSPGAGIFDPTSIQDFSVDRTGAHVKNGQFWAIYDKVTDEMPRFYCLVHEVKEAPIFDVVLLEPTSEIDDWLMNRSFAPATGEFRLSEWKITCRDRTMLSQLMDVRMREGGGYEVCPQVGEVWALYADYGEVVDFDAFKRQAYDLGLVEGHVADHERACRLRKLERVEGCANLWAAHGEPRWYLYEDYLGRFSHRVPAVPVPCDLDGVPRFCMVLDPCSLPDNNPAPDTSTELRRISN